MKKRLLKLISLILVALATQACTEQLPAEESCNFVLNSSHRRVSWNQLPVPYYVDNSVDPATYQAIREAASVWNEEFQESAGHDAIQILGRTEELPQPNDAGEPPKDGYNAIYYIPKGTGFDDTEQARTALHYKGDNIHEADIVINGRLEFFIGESSGASGASKVELVSLMIHEMGHALGLDHIDKDDSGKDVDSVMQTRLAFNDPRRTLQEEEIESLQCEY